MAFESICLILLSIFGFADACYYYDYVYSECTDSDYTYTGPIVGSLFAFGAVVFFVVLIICCRRRQATFGNVFSTSGVRGQTAIVTSTTVTQPYVHQQGQMYPQQQGQRLHPQQQGQMYPQQPMSPQGYGYPQPAAQQNYGFQGQQTQVVHSPPNMQAGAYTGNMSQNPPQPGKDTQALAMASAPPTYDEISPPSYEDAFSTKGPERHYQN